jgi:hypothetical protein
MFKMLYLQLIFIIFAMNTINSMHERSNLNPNAQEFMPFTKGQVYYLTDDESEGYLKHEDDGNDFKFQEQWKIVIDGM